MWGSVVSIWVWNLHSSHRYTVINAYQSLTEEAERESYNNSSIINDNLLWIKEISLKINLFSCCLILNRIPTRENLVRWNVLLNNVQICTIECGLSENMYHLFVTCDFYCKIWMVVSFWLDFSTTAQGNLLNHLIQFTKFGGFSK